MVKKHPATHPDSDLQVKLGAVVRRYRHHLEITQEELAWRASMHRTYIADVERGVRNVTLRIVAKLARALDVTVGNLFAQACAPAGAALLLNGQVAKHAAAGGALPLETIEANSTYTIVDAARLLKVRPSLVQTRVRQGLLTGTGRPLRISGSDLLRFQKQNPSK